MNEELQNENKENTEVQPAATAPAESVETTEVATPAEAAPSEAAAEVAAEAAKPECEEPQIIVQKERGFAHYVGFAMLCVLCICFFFMPGIALTFGVSRIVENLPGAAAWIQRDIQLCHLAHLQAQDQGLQEVVLLVHRPLRGRSRYPRRYRGPDREGCRVLQHRRPPHGCSIRIFP